MRYGLLGCKNSPDIFPGRRSYKDTIPGFNFLRLLWQPYGIGQTIIFLSCGFFYLLSSFFFSSPILSRRRLDFHTWCGRSVNLECRSATCCTQLTENTGRKNRQNSPSVHRKLCRAISSQLRYVSTTGKNLLNSDFSLTYNMVNFGPLAAEIGLLVWETPANFNGFHS